MEALEITSITNFMLASEVFFVAGLLLGKDIDKKSPAAVWGFALISLAIAALLGGIDHGFFEANRDGTLIRTVIQRVTWAFIALTTLLVLITSGFQFFDKKYWKIFYLIGSIQFFLSVILSILFESFLLVILNYAPVMLFFLILHIIHLKDNKGSLNMIIGLILSFIAAGIQQSKWTAFSPVDNNGLYHLVMMIAVIFLYYGGIQLKHKDQ